MRFSLGALVLIVIWLGTGGMVWALQKPWVKASWPAHIPKFKNWNEFIAYYKTMPSQSPDGMRILSAVNPSDGFAGPMD